MGKKRQGRALPFGDSEAGLLLHLVGLVHLVGLLRGLLLLRLGLLVALLVLGGLLHLVLLVLRNGARRREGGSGHGSKHRGDDQGKHLAHFVLLVGFRKRVDATSRALPGASNAPPEARVDRRRAFVCRSELNHCFLKTVAAV